ncbi:histone-lysine N-methyltransferase SUV39H1-like [Aphelenchoides avenae]|nr:histone-lysine N-methyltransferase SUV39H1-like [Aphelenchus avenae]
MAFVRGPLVGRQTDVDDDDDVQIISASIVSKRARFSPSALDSRGAKHRFAASCNNKENSARRDTAVETINTAESGSDDDIIEVPVERKWRSTAHPVNYTEAITKTFYSRYPLRARQKSACKRSSDVNKDASRGSILHHVVDDDEQPGYSGISQFINNTAARGSGAQYERHRHSYSSTSYEARPIDIKAYPTDNTGQTVVGEIMASDEDAEEPSTCAKAITAEDQDDQAHEMIECGAIEVNHFQNEISLHSDEDIPWVIDVFISRVEHEFDKIINDWAAHTGAELEEADDGVEDRFGVDKVLFVDKKESNTALVKWRDWPYKIGYWEAIENLTDCDNLFAEYRRRLKQNTAIAENLKLADKRYWPELWNAPAFLGYNEWEDEISRTSVEAGCAPLYVENWVDKEAKPKNFVFITENIISDATRATFVKPPENVKPCKCDGSCGSGPSCCPKAHGQAFYYTPSGRLRNNFNPKRDELFECTPECSCNFATCPNRIVQRGRQFPVILFRTADRGWSVRTAAKIPPRTFVMEYVGEVLPIEKADERSNRYAFDINGHAYGETKFFIDSEHYGNEARFVNHSCQPNLESVNVFCEHEDMRYWRIAFISGDEEIPAGAELTLNYFGADKKKLASIVAGRKKQTCFCGAPKCYKFLF